MLKDINIKINGLSDELSLKVVDKFRDLIHQFSFLDFRRFSNIIITQNFERDIESLTTTKKSYFKNRYRANNDTFASVITIPREEEFELVLVFRSEFIKSIIKEKDSKAYKNALHIINHEFAHIHDNNKKIDVFKELMRTKSYKGIDSILYPIAETCWSEYIANFISSQSAIDTDYPKVMAQSLVSKIKTSQKDIQTSLLAYKINKQRYDLVEDSIKQVESILKSASYLLGYLNGMKITLEELDYEANYILETSYFKDIWEALKHELASIHQVYPHGFINLSIYKNLSFYIDAYFNQMGIVFSENEGKLEIKLF